MDSRLETLEKEAMQLTSHARAELAIRLIASLDDGPADVPAEVERAWDEEIRRRLVGVELGMAEMASAEEVFSELHARPSRATQRGRDG